MASRINPSARNTEPYTGPLLSDNLTRCPGPATCGTSDDTWYACDETKAVVNAQNSAGVHIRMSWGSGVPRKAAPTMGGGTTLHAMADGFLLKRETNGTNSNHKKQKTKASLTLIQRSGKNGPHSPQKTNNNKAKT